jgi:hypothetical protein
MQRGEHLLSPPAACRWHSVPKEVLMPTGPNEPRPDYTPWIITGALLAGGLAYVTYLHPALASPLAVAIAAVGVLGALVRR